MLGGTFDPIHLAHLIIAEEARVRLDLEEVVFIPTGEPWMKVGTPVSSGHHRLNMARLAIASNPFFRVSSMEVDRPGPSYTVDTLEALGAEYGEEVRFYFILGIDSIREFHRWKEPGRILELANLVTVTRPGYNEFDVASLDALAEGAEQRVEFLDGIAINIGGRELRHSVAEGKSILYRVCDQVARYISEHGLYRDGDGGV